MVSSAGGAHDDHRENDIAHFRDVTEASGEQARFYLEASDWRFDRAVAMFYGMSCNSCMAPLLWYYKTALHLRRYSTQLNRSFARLQPVFSTWKLSW